MYIYIFIYVYLYIYICVCVCTYQCILKWQIINAHSQKRFDWIKENNFFERLSLIWRNDLFELNNIFSIQRKYLWTKKNIFKANKFLLPIKLYILIYITALVSLFWRKIHSGRRYFVWIKKMLLISNKLFI